MESTVWVVLTWLFPIGLILLGAASVPPEEAPRRAGVAWLGMATAILAYAGLGFGFQFGGLGLVSDLPGSEGLIREWGPLDVAWGLGYGVIGLGGFDLLAGNLSPELGLLFVHQAALLASAVCILALALGARLSPLSLNLAALLVGGFFYPVFGNWVWGGGWLSQLGNTVALGHGFVDLAGAGTVHALGAGLAVAGLVALEGRSSPPKRGAQPPPPAHFPLLGILGGFAILVGWFGMALGNPLARGSIDYALIALNGLLASSAGLFMAALYTGIFSGRVDLLMGLRGWVAGLVALSGVAGFTWPLASLLVGAAAGVLVPLAVYAFEVKLRLPDVTAAGGTHLIPGLLGLLAVGWVADGRSGWGWNGVGQGIAGLWTAAGYLPSPAQLYAQTWGSVALLVLAVGLGWTVFSALRRAGIWPGPSNS